MDDTPDPSAQFFPDVPLEDIDLYAVLNLVKTTTAAEIKKAYRTLALVHHPDKHANSPDTLKASSTLKFQQVGFAYAVLSDEKKRARYDQTGRTDEGGGLFGGDGEGGWEAYFEEMFEKVNRAKLDELKETYQGSEEEIADLREAYVKTKGSIEGILSEIPHSTVDDEARFIAILTPLVASKELPSFRQWDKDIKDTKGKEKRKKKADKEAEQAEQHAKDLGVWDEFYGTGKEGKRKTKGKGKGKEDDAVDETALQAIILRRAEKRGNIFDGLLAKYGGGDGVEEDMEELPKTKKKRKGKAEEEEDMEDVEPPKKRSRMAAATKGSRNAAAGHSRKGRKARG